MLDATGATETTPDSTQAAETPAEQGGSQRSTPALQDAARTADAADGEEQQADGEADAAEAELVEHEHGGKRYRVPKAIVPALMMHADYTRKTQEVAEERRRLEGERAQHAEWVAAQQRHARDFARISLLDHQIAQFRTMDWDALEQNDPGRAQSLLRQLNFLKEDRAKLAAEIDAKEAKWRSDAQQDTARRVEEGHRILERAIPGWGPELARTLGAFATSIGYSQADVEAVSDPRAIRVLHLAHVGQQLLDKQKQATQPRPRPATPLPQLGQGRAPQSGGPRDDQPIDDWVAARNRQVRRKRT